MDTAYRRRAAVSSRPVRRTKRPGRQNEDQGDRRRLIQLLVSLALFLLVYIGRGVFPARFELWRNAILDDVDFSAAFQEFRQAMSDGQPLGESLEALSVRILGGEPGPEPEAEPDKPDSTAKTPVNIILLGQTPGAGLTWLNTHGIMESIQPLPKTAVPQEYSEDGVKLPSNVSFAFYELGLPETVDPVTGPVTSAFGYRDDPITGEYGFHLALDIGAEEGTEVGAFAGGVVESVGEDDVYGLNLKITHANGVRSFYAHCSEVLVNQGETVACGQTVALVGQTGGATGPHLHFAIEKDNVRLDPAHYVGRS